MADPAAVFANGMSKAATKEVESMRRAQPSPEYLDVVCKIRSPVQQAGAGLLGGAGVGAKVGANVHSHQATLSDVQPRSPQVNATSGDTGLRQATGRR
jgi:hypothetical protein